LTTPLSQQEEIVDETDVLGNEVGVEGSSLLTLI
jgi:hypothetical protein